MRKKLNLEENNSNHNQLQKEVKRYYREIERYDWVNDAKYPEKLFHALRAKRICSIVNSLANNGSQAVLDVGCGTGLITRLLKSNDITALDINPWALERAKLNIKNKNVKFVLGDAEDLFLPSDKYDVIVCTEMLEHLVRPDLAAKEINRVLKPGALLVGSVPSKSLFWKYRKYITRTSPVQEPFHNNYTIEEFRPLLDGFDIIELQYGVFGLAIIFIARKPAKADEPVQAQNNHPELVMNSAKP